MLRSAAVLHATLSAIGCLFQLLLAAGKPWGQLAMGGKHPGRFPTKLRIAALGQAVVIALVSLVVLSRAGLALPAWHAASQTLIWAVVGLSTLSALMNLITPSNWERIVWAPVTLLLLASSLTVALGR